MVEVVWRGRDFVDDDNNPMDELGHGTHVAGTVGAVGNNGEGVSGVMWDVQLMPLKIFDPDTTLTGSCSSAFASDIIAAIGYAVAKGAKVMNASFSSEGYCISEYNAIASANANEVLFIAAAGNEGDNNDLTSHYPSSYDLPNIISVAATDQNDIRVPFSNYGPISVDVGAPGVYIFSTVLLGSVISDETYGILDFFAGTSMAAPHVSGLAGLLWSYYTHFDHLQIKETILRYGEPLDSLNGWVATGKRINAYKALSSLLTPTGLTATFSSSVSLSWTDNAKGEDGYRIERSEQEGSFEEIAADLPADSNSYPDNDPDLVPTKTYTYRVTATNTIPAASHAVQAIIPVAPTALIATVISSSEVELTWTDNSNNETGFEIWRKTGSGGTSERIDTVGANIETYSNTGLAKNTYFYKVRAYAGTSTGFSAFSNEEKAKTGSSGGGGNCSIGARQNTPTAVAGIALMLLPLVFITILRRRRKYRD
ncbi:MAG: S8 family serine peptidase [Candidatus Mariimomonas ferrooxydans]